MGRRSRIVIAITLLFVGLFATGFVLLYTLDFNTFKGVISDAVRDATGRELSIAGDVALSRSLPPTLSISDVTFANAPWGTKSQMVSVDKLQVQVALLPLLKRQLVFKRLDLSGTTMFLETDAKGRGNWELETASDPGSGTHSIRGVQLGLIHINDLNLTFSNGKSGWETQFELASLVVERLSTEKKFSVELSGAWRGQAVVLSGSVGMLADARAGNPFAIDLSGQVAGDKITLTGNIADLFNLTGLDLKLAAGGANLAHLGTVVEVKLPRTESYEVTARLGGSRQTLKVTELQGTIRSNGVSFDVSGMIGNLTTLGDVALQLQVSGTDLSLLDAHGKLDWGGVSLTANGAVAGLETMSGIDLKATAAGTSLDQVGRLIDQSWPKTGPFELSGRLTGRKDVLALRGARALVSHGNLTLSATGTVNNLMTLKGVSLEVTASGKEFAELSPLIGMKLSRLGSFKLTGNSPDRLLNLCWVMQQH